jgi:hypothetical protein
VVTVCTRTTRFNVKNTLCPSYRLNLFCSCPTPRRHPYPLPSRPSFPTPNCVLVSCYGYEWHTAARNVHFTLSNAVLSPRLLGTRLAATGGWMRLVRCRAKTRTGPEHCRNNGLWAIQLLLHEHSVFQCSVSQTVRLDGRCVGREITIIIINSTTQKLSCILSTSSSLVPQ